MFVSKVRRLGKIALRHVRTALRTAASTFLRQQKLQQSTTQ